MSELHEQLAELRQRIARVSVDCDRKFGARMPGASERFASAVDFAELEGLDGIGRGGIEDDAITPDSIVNRLRIEDGHEHAQAWLSGQEVETEHGRHFETEKLYEHHRRHGSADIGSLADLPHDLLASLSADPSADPIPHAPPSEWAFLDTETTGLSGGTGTCAFLIGVGRITPEGFRVRQFFMRDYGEESSALHAVAAHLAEFRVMITYNGRTFDQPLLETRYRLNRAKSPFTKLDHLDLLHGARRLWKLRFDSCRLVDLENQVLGVERHGDLPGALIPYVYFDYLRTRDAARMVSIFHHNATDILTLACLTGIVPYAFRDPGESTLKNGAELAGIARWLRAAGELDQARKLFRRAVDAGLRDDLLFQTLWDMGTIDRKLGAVEDALAVWTDLAESRNAFRVRAMEELAKHYEHREKNYARALELTRGALEYEESVGLRKREERLSRRCTQIEKQLATNEHE
jgi:uncharacterized protein YprB with RNaseH-like and TPR domain